MQKAVLFDFDGVIADSLPTQYDWLKKICGIFGKPFSYKAPVDLRAIHFEKVVPDLYLYLGFDWEKEGDSVWAEYYKHKASMQPELVKGIEGVIEELWCSTVPLGIASNALGSEIKTHLKRLNMNKYFDTVVGREDKKQKPDPEILLAAAEEIKIKPENCFYIGDAPSDVQAARNAGMTPIAAYFGDSAYKSLDSLLSEQPDFIITNPADLLGIVFERM